MDEDGGRWSGGKVRTVTEVEIEQEGRGNSIVLCRKVDDGAKREDKDSAERELLGISFVSALNSLSSYTVLSLIQLSFVRILACILCLFLKDYKYLGTR